MCTLVCNVIDLKFYIDQPKLCESCSGILVKFQNISYRSRLREKKILERHKSKWEIVIKGERMLVEGGRIFVES